MSVLGVDLAASPKKTYACTLERSNSTLTATLHVGCDDDTLRNLARGCQKVAIDAPFGWPNAFVDALTAHRRAEAWPAPDDEAPEVFRASLSFRTTDRIVMHTRQPLSVSTDKLGVTAMRCAYLLHRWATEGEIVDRSGRRRFVEVYPAAALVRWGLPGGGYKGLGGRNALAALLSQVTDAAGGLVLSDVDRKLCSANDDAFDALLAALVAQAALLGLTDGPPVRHKTDAVSEGWIHLPLRGSLPFLTRPKDALVARPEAALAERLRTSGVALTPAGYVQRFDDAVLPGFSSATRKRICADLEGKGGSELAQYEGGVPKFHAAHSSSALAANVFGPFLTSGAEGVPLGGQTYAGERHLEVECATGLAGTPPTLDFAVVGEHVLAVESKLTEPFRRHEAKFRPSYRKAMASAHPSWRREYEWLDEDPRRYRYLDAAQLIKHYLGLRQIP